MVPHGVTVVVNRRCRPASATRVRRNRAVRITEVVGTPSADHFTVNIILRTQINRYRRIVHRTNRLIHRRDVRHRTVIILNRVLEPLSVPLYRAAFGVYVTVPSPFTTATAVINHVIVTCTRNQLITPAPYPHRSPVR